MIRHKTQTQEAKWGDHGIKLVMHCGVLSVGAQKIQADTDKVILCMFLFLQRQCCVSWPPQLHFPSGSVWASCVRTHRSEDVHNYSSFPTQTSVTVGRGVTHCAWCPQVVPLHVKTASMFCGRIVRKGDTAFQNMLAEMAVYYGDKKPVAKELLEGCLYAVEVDEEIHRWGPAPAVATLRGVGWGGVGVQALNAWFRTMTIFCLWGSTRNISGCWLVHVFLLMEKDFPTVH